MIRPIYETTTQFLYQIIALPAQRVHNKAPHTFTLDLPAQMAIITNQPNNAIEYEKSMAALKSCPVSAIEQRP